MPTPDYDLLSLRLFVSVVDCRNIGRAAKANNIAASAVSKRISDLEARARVTLLYRLREGVEPTPAGQALYRQARLMLELQTRMDAEISDYAVGAEGVVRIFANSSAVTQFLPEDLAAFSQSFPKVRFDLREETSGRNVEAVKDGRADVAIFSEHVSATDLQTRIYRRDTLMLAVPRGHALAGKSKVGFDEVVAFDHVGLQDDSSLQAKVQAEAQRLGLALRTRVFVLSFDAVRQMVGAGLGVAVLPKGAVEPYADSLDIATVAINEPWATRSLLIGYRDYDSLPVVCRRLIEHLAPIGPNV